MSQPPSPSTPPSPGASGSDGAGSCPPPPVCGCQELKECRSCGAKLPPESFNKMGGTKASGGSPYRKAMCKTCEREEHRKRRLRHTEAGPRPPACECCLRTGKLYLDHCHTTELNRGWLCHKCNTGIGKLGDHLIGLRKTLAYMLRFLGREGLSEEETRSPSGDTPEGCCKRCGEHCEESDFRVTGRTIRGVFRMHTCRACEAADARQRYQLAKCVGPPAPACELCSKEGPTMLDHCHVTGRFRGWLCHDCNTGLGKLGDDTASVRRALAYLDRWLDSIQWPDAPRARSRSPRHTWLLSPGCCPAPPHRQATSRRRGTPLLPAAGRHSRTRSAPRRARPASGWRPG